MANKLPFKNKNELAEIACSALESAFEDATSLGSAPTKSRFIVANDTEKKVVYKYDFESCPISVDVMEQCVRYTIQPKRSLIEDGATYVTEYVLFEDVPSDLHDSFSRIMESDFTALFRSADVTPYNWKDTGTDARESLPFFLTDVEWIDVEQTAPVALRYPDQTYTSKKIISLFDMQRHSSEVNNKYSYFTEYDGVLKDDEILLTAHKADKDSSMCA